MWYCRKGTRPPRATWLAGLTGAILGAWCSTVFAAAPLPPDFSARYTINKGFIELGTAWRSLQSAGEGRYVYTSKSRSNRSFAWLFKQDEFKETRFDLADGRIRPLAYRHIRVRDKKKTVEQTYDWAQKEVRSRIDGEKHTFALVDAALDQNVYQLSLMVDLAGGETVMDYELAENKRLKSYHIKRIGNETVETPLGRYETVIIENVDKDATITMWCAKKLHYLPVKIAYKEGALGLTAVIDSLKGMAPATDSP